MQNQNNEEKNDDKDGKIESANKLMSKSEFCWEVWNDEEKTSAKKIAEEYLDFLRNARTERERTTYVKNLAEKNGFKMVKLGIELDDNLIPGDKIYYQNRKKNIALVIIGKQPITERCNFIGTHIDAPRLDLKIKPLYDDSKAGLSLFKTHYYGGIKKYQFATIPLHLTGVVVKSDGTTIEIDIGKDSNDPVFTIPDLLIHLSKTVQNKRTTPDVIKGEEMNVLAGSLPIIPSEDGKKVKEKFKLNVLEILNKKYGIDEDDLISAELSFVSGINPRYIGFDKSLIGGAGQDDGVCSYLGVKAILDLDEIPTFTSITTLFDKEEIGSNGVTGAKSAWMRFVMNDILVRVGVKETPTNLNLMLTNTKMISADVGAALNPTFKSVHDLRNVAVLGKGIVLEKYTGAGGKRSASDASAETMAFFRKIFDDGNVNFQIGNLGAVDAGGGGTIAKFFAESFNCDVVDAGTPVLNMHSPYEITHIADIYATYCAFSTFFKS